MEDVLGLFDITDVVFQSHLFPLLSRNDLLRLRRVCKAAKPLVEEHLRVHHVDNPQYVEITDDNTNPDRNLSAFVKMGIPCARIYLNNSSLKWFEDPGMVKFIAEYADKITHLRVRNFYAFANDKEMPFYEALTSLEHLTLENVDARSYRCNYINKSGCMVPKKPCPVAKTFKQLKTLKFGQVKTSQKLDHGYWSDIVKSCREHLETIGHPLHDDSVPHVDNPLGLDDPQNPELTHATVTRIFLHVNRNVLGLRSGQSGQLKKRPNLRFYDFENFLDFKKNLGSVMDFILFAQSCYEHKTMLLNVHADLFTLLGPPYTSGLDDPVKNLISVRNVSRTLFKWELPRLEKVVIYSTSESSFYPRWEEQDGLGHPPQWPALKVLDMTVDDVELSPLPTREGPEPVAVEYLYDFLFRTEVPRENLEELAIRFEEKASEKMNLPWPRMVDVRQNCPNLKILTLQNWTGTNKVLSKLWGGLRLLEELTLEDCKQLGNVAFVGEDKEKPTFLKLTNLKILTLNGLEIMPKLTNTLFGLIVRKMKLIKLFLGSRKPVKHITPTGIKALLSGDFASSIEKFPFVGWSLMGVSAEEFKQLERQFRSFYMI